MKTVLLKSNSNSDIELILILAKKLGIEIEKINNLENTNNPDNVSLNKITSNTFKHNFLNSRGLWKNRNVDSKLLRQEAWKIQS